MWGPSLFQNRLDTKSVRCHFPVKPGWIWQVCLFMWIHKVKSQLGHELTPAVPHSSTSHTNYPAHKSARIGQQRLPTGAKEILYNTRFGWAASITVSQGLKTQWKQLYCGGDYFIPCPSMLPPTTALLVCSHICPRFHIIWFLIKKIIMKV